MDVAFVCLGEFEDSLSPDVVVFLLAWVPCSFCLEQSLQICILNKQGIYRYLHLNIVCYFVHRHRLGVDRPSGALRHFGDGLQGNRNIEEIGQLSAFWDALAVHAGNRGHCERSGSLAIGVPDVEILDVVYFVGNLGLRGVVEVVGNLIVGRCVSPSGRRHPHVVLAVHILS